MARQTLSLTSIPETSASLLGPKGLLLRCGWIRSYLVLPQEAPIHLPVKLVFTVIVCPLPEDVICPEPLTLSGLSTSMFIVPVDFTSPYSHDILISALVAVDVTIEDLHSF